MKKLVLGLIVSTIFILSGCQTGVMPVYSPAPSTTSEPAGSWEIGQNLTYSQESIWGDTFVGLELNLADSDSKAGQVPQSIVIYDLNTKERKRVIEPPEGYMVEAPSIYGNKIVFAAVNRDEYLRAMLSSKRELPPNWDTFVYYLETNQMQQLTTEEHAQMSPRIYGDTVVWLDTRHVEAYNLDRYDVYAYNLKTGVEKRLTSMTTAEGRDLAVSGNIVVWTDDRHADPPMAIHAENERGFNNEIYAYDLSTDQEKRITDYPGNDRHPAVDGNKIVWLRQLYQDYVRADIFLYNMETGRETQLSTSGYAANQFSPSINGDRIVWADASSSQGNTNNDVIINGTPGSSTIVLFDLKAQKETRLTPAEDVKVWLWPVIHDNHVVFEWSRQIGGIAYALNLP